MGLSPLEIHNKEFPKKVIGGYNPDAVDEFLDQVIREFELLIKENAHLKEQAEALRVKLEQYKNLEETINKTLVVAQETAEDMRSNAKKQGDLIIQEA
ncbi:MAG: divIVA, partial [Firmicutes bacterium]|nr:divIVA [Bacillota bacterium]